MSVWLDNLIHQLPPGTQITSSYLPNSYAKTEDILVQLCYACYMIQKEPFFEDYTSMPDSKIAEYALARSQQNQAETEGECWSRIGLTGRPDFRQNTEALRAELRVMSENENFMYSDGYDGKESSMWWVELATLLAMTYEGAISIDAINAFDIDSF